MLCCSALKIHLLSSILHGTCSIHFTQTVILECINESTNNLYHTMTVLLEYIDRSLQFSINAIAINLCFALPYYVSILLKYFQSPIMLKITLV